ncbi:hypothetical protein LCGC14_0147450 [marine sediment metagenome]|uniref:Uncharacterized protein n=1 Tax=marine sediment metagenome TaxID=412755 RepID=A0A0F9Y1U4_9ZZZZ
MTSITLNLTVAERILLSRAFNELKGSLILLRQGGSILDILQLTDDEKDGVMYEELPNGQARWKDNLSVDLKFNPTEFEFFKNIIGNKQDWPMQALEVLEKIDNVEEEKET